MIHRDVYIEKMQARLHQWSAELDRLHAKAEEAEADARADYQKQIANLEAKRDKVRADFERLKEAGDTAWGDIQTGLEAAWKDLDDAMRNAMQRSL